MGCTKSRTVSAPGEVPGSDLDLCNSKFTKQTTKNGIDHRRTSELLQCLTSQTSFSEKELREYLKAFKKKHPKGRMSAKDIEETFNTVFKQGDASQISEQMLQMFDSDGNGYIDFSELVTILSITQTGSSEDKMRLAFDMIDSDNNGVIDKREMIELVTALHKLVGITVVHVNAAEDDTPEKHVELMMQKLDPDGDDVITFEEFCQGVKNDPAVAQLLTAQTNPDLLAARIIGSK